MVGLSVYASGPPRLQNMMDIFEPPREQEVNNKVILLWQWAQLWSFDPSIHTAQTSAWDSASKYLYFHLGTRRFSQIVTHSTYFPVLTNSVGALIWQTLSYLSCTVPGVSWVQHVPAESRAGVQGQRSYSSLMACISGFSTCICAGEVGSGYCRCHRKCPTSDTPELWIQPWECQGRSKAVPLLVLQKGWSHNGAKVEGQHPSKAAVPPKISLASANRCASS